MNIKKLIREEMDAFDWTESITDSDIVVGKRFNLSGSNHYIEVTHVGDDSFTYRLDGSDVDMVKSKEGMLELIKKGRFVPVL